MPRAAEHNQEIAMDRRALLKYTAGFLAASPWLPSHAKEAYPSRPIRIVVSSGHTSPTDFAGRVVGDLLSRRFGQPVTVENRPGAGGMVGLQHVAQSPADGYTLATGGLGNHVIPPVVIKNLPFDVIASFVPIAQVAEFVNVLVVSNDSKLESVQDLLRQAKAEPGKLNYASVGAGTSSHLTSELLALQGGTQFTHVPYGKASESMIDVANGTVAFSFANLPAAMPLLRGNKLKALGVSSAYRSEHLPGIPTLQEQGVKDFDVSSWMGIYGPAGMPVDIVRLLGDAISEGLKADEYRKRLSEAGCEPKTLASEKFLERNRAEVARWSEVVKKAGISVNFGGS
jgi:tripartite-type tricarboxylate transporter receptor subunit TctC